MRLLAPDLIFAKKLPGFDRTIFTCCKNCLKWAYFYVDFKWETEGISKHDQSSWKKWHGSHSDTYFKSALPGCK